MLDNNLVK